MHIVLWYPAILYRDRDLKIKKPIQFQIDDRSDHRFWVTLTYKEDSAVGNSITIRSAFEDEEKKHGEFTVVLKEKAKSKNGFAVYECEETDVPAIYRDKFFSDELLLKPIYNKIKEFYHVHEADIEKDSAIKAQTKRNGTDRIEDYLKDDNFLVNLLTDFEILFRDAVLTISDYNLNLQNKFDKFSAENNKKKLKFLAEETMRLNKQCENALIEYTYCKTLLNSIYNIDFHHNAKVEFVEEDDTEKIKTEKKSKRDLRRKALNIRNSIRYVENIKFKNQNRQHILLTEIINKGDNIQFTGSILAFLGVFYAIWFGFEIDKPYLLLTISLVALLPVIYKISEPLRYRIKKIFN